MTEKSSKIIGFSTGISVDFDIGSRFFTTINNYVEKLLENFEKIPYQNYTLSREIQNNNLNVFHLTYVCTFVRHVSIGLFEHIPNLYNIF